MGQVAAGCSKSATFYKNADFCQIFVLSKTIFPIWGKL